ncbi:MAG TPA: hypothetical protein VHY37_13815 [Tepidisphaeraceae bacterium]|jgi:hypothetical protein|nr:hypothetical protein [Tepidisphaeraceae bacterium]
MKVQDVLQHYGIYRNPFHQEDAQEDPIFSDAAGSGGAVKHAAWDKIFGSASDPSSSVVFGEKGSGKTALRLQMTDSIRRHNRAHPRERAFLIEYDDFNPFLDTFTRGTGTLDQWELHDHIDAILSLGVRRVVEMVLRAAAGRGGNGSDAVSPEAVRAMGRLTKRDLLLLTAMYDRSAAMPPSERFRMLRRRLHYYSASAAKPTAIGFVVTILMIVVMGALWYWLPGLRKAPWAGVVLGLGLFAILVGWVPTFLMHWRAAGRAKTLRKYIRVLEPATPAAQHAWRSFAEADLADQPLEHLETTDSRYVLLEKFRGVLAALGFTSVIVLVDRVDEPHAINGRSEAIHQVMRSIFDLKFLKHPGIGVKLLLPRELYAYVGRESPAFHERARLDKQNLIPNLEWSGEALYDLAAERLAACAKPPPGSNGPAKSAAVAVLPAAGGTNHPDGPSEADLQAVRPVLRQLFEESVTDTELTRMFDRLRTPRNLFKFLYQLLSAHAQKYTIDNPSWKIDRPTLETTFALFERGMDRSTSGMPVGF